MSFDKLEFLCVKIYYVEKSEGKKLFNMVLTQNFSEYKFCPKYTQLQ